MGRKVKCRRCHRVLKSKRSKRLGIGDDCAKAERMQAIIDTFPTDQIARAKELLDLKAMRPVPQVFEVVSSDGEARYMTTADSCTCTAGQFEKMCYHRLAVMMWNA